MKFPTDLGKFVWTSIPIGKAHKFGGPGSGDFGHPGRPGEVGGSGPQGTGDRPHHEALADQAKEGDKALEALLPQALKEADFSAVLTPGMAWINLTDDEQATIREEWITAHVKDYQDAGQRAAEDWVVDHLTPKDVIAEAKPGFLRDAAENGLLLDPDSIDRKVIQKSSWEYLTSTVDLHLASLRTVDGQPLTAAQLAVADKLFQDHGKTAKETLIASLLKSDGAEQAAAVMQRDSATVAWDLMDMEPRVAWASKVGLMTAPEPQAKLPTVWRYDHNDGDETHIGTDDTDPDYLRTRALGLKLVQLRTAQLLQERGVPPLRPWTKDDSGTGFTGADLGAVWTDWKHSSTSTTALALQLATTKELGAVNYLPDDAVETALIQAAYRFTTKEEKDAAVPGWRNSEDIYGGGVASAAHEASNNEQLQKLGMARLQAYTRAQWETSQFILDKAGAKKLDVYRAILLPDTDLKAASKESVLPGEGNLGGEMFTKLPELQLQRNNLASTTFEASVANHWNGDTTKGAVSNDRKSRVVLRFSIPKEAAFSLPVFGQNVHNEREVVILGAKSGLKWDAWLRSAPEFKNVAIAWREDFAFGGEGSGDFGHAGRPGEVGGSAPSGGGDVPHHESLAQQAAEGDKALEALLPEALKQSFINDEDDRSVAWEHTDGAERAKVYGAWLDNHDGEPEFAREQWDDLADHERYEYGVKAGLLQDRTIGVPPHRWTYDSTDDPNDFESPSDPDYQRTRAIAVHLVGLRLEQLAKERGLPPFIQPGNYDGMTGISETVWDEWKEASTAPVAMALQLAATEELGAVNYLSPKDVTIAKNAAASYFTSRLEKGQLEEKNPSDDSPAFTPVLQERGMARLKAYARAQWETTQFILDKAGVKDLDAYRAIMLEQSEVDAAKHNWVDVGGGDFKQLPDLQLQRNNLASATFTRRVANQWGGTNENTKLQAPERVVLRFHIPKVAAFSLPVFGQNHASEREIVLLGAKSGVKWDAWSQQAPSFSGLPVKYSEVAMAEKKPLVVDLFEIDKAAGVHWLSQQPPKPEKAVEKPPTPEKQ